MSWTVLTEPLLLSVINNSELEKARQVAQQAGQSDPVDPVLDQVTALVRGYVRRKYELEASGVPPSLVAISLDIVAYRIGSRLSSKLSEGRKGAYEDAMKLLREVASGDFVVEDAVTISESAEVAPVEIVSKLSRKTTRQKLEGI